MNTFEERLGYRFRDRALLRNALTHSSYANEHRRQGLASNERLEFLGDSILGMVTAEYLYARYPDCAEGELTRIRADLVCEKALAAVAVKLDLGADLLLGHGESTGGGNHRPSMLADAVEAVLAAVYLDGGMEAVKPLIHTLILSADTGGQRIRDYKTTLQELVQREPNQEIVYLLTGEHGPDHAKSFEVAVTVNGITVGKGSGSSKKRAEQSAAAAAIGKLFPEEA